MLASTLTTATAMNKRLLLWALPALAYIVLALWYTNLGGALSDDEIEAFAAQFEAGGGEPEQAAQLRQFMEQDTGNQFLMVNVVDLNEVPSAIPGAAPVPTTAAAMEHYMAYMYPALLSRASHPVIAGAAVFDAMDLAGIEGAEHWEQAALMRYRSRRDLMEIATNPEMRVRHPYKLAAIEKTIAFPIEPTLYLGDPRLLLALAVLALTALADLAIYRRRIQ